MATAASAAFPAQDVSVPVARRFAVAALEEWGREDQVDAVALLAGELVANAVVHARTDFVVRVERLDGGLRVEVADRSAAEPVRRRDVGPDATNGRGLQLVEALSDRWGFEPSVEGGKVVWAEVEAGG